MSLSPFSDSQPDHVDATPLYAGDDDYFISGHFYPFLPIIRTIPKYMKDKYSKSLSACNKFYPKKGRATAGLFLAYCTEHGKLLGFHAMKYAESCRTVHNLLFSRFEHAPAFVVTLTCS